MEYSKKYIFVFLEAFLVLTLLGKFVVFKKAIYDLEWSSRSWFKKFSKQITHLGLKGLFLTPNNFSDNIKERTLCY